MQTGNLQGIGLMLAAMAALSVMDVIRGQLPGPVVFAVAAVIVGSGLYLLQRECVPQPVTPPL